MSRDVWKLPFSRMKKKRIDAFQQEPSMEFGKHAIYWLSMQKKGVQKEKEVI